MIELNRLYENLFFPLETMRSSNITPTPGNGAKWKVEIS